METVRASASERVWSVSPRCVGRRAPDSLAWHLSTARCLKVSRLFPCPGVLSESGGIARPAPAPAFVGTGSAAPAAGAPARAGSPLHHGGYVCAMALWFAQGKFSRAWRGRCVRNNACFYALQYQARAFVSDGR